MPSSLLYITKLSASLALVWLLYQLLFRKLTFYRCNRWYLLGYTLLSFFIPLINIEPILENRPSGEPLVLQFIPTIGNYTGVLSFATRSDPWKSDVWSGLLAVMVLGAIVLGVRLAVRWLSLRRIRRQAKLITDTDLRIYQVDANIIPFSFGNAIYINQRLHTEKEWEEIILHEYVHIRQQHTIDILLAELFCILNWYNPFVWLIRHSIRQNLEFIADSKVLENGFDKKSYQYHLLKVIGEPRYRLANNFNFSSLKKRIVMMNKIRSARLHLIKFLFILPLIAVLLVAFRDRPSFEKLYGQLPDFIPATTISTHTGELAKPPVRNSSSRTATVPNTSGTVPISISVIPKNTEAGNNGQAQPALVHLDFLPAQPLFILNGNRMPEGWKLDSIPPDSIASVAVLKNESAVALYGKAGANGVVQIRTKDFVRSISRMQPIDAMDPFHQPLLVVDGVITAWKNRDGTDGINPADIESINILKGDSALRRFGDQAINGAILVYMKKKPTSYGQPRVTMDTKDGKMVLQADSISIPKAGITVTSAKGSQ